MEPQSPYSVRSHVSATHRPQDTPTFKGDTEEEDVPMGNLDEGYHTGRGPVASSSPSADDVREMERPPVNVEVMGRGIKKIVATIDRLRELGIEDLVQPLPKIVVVGDQSSGKSSLIEALSEIKVPRSTGTCTRCPLEINLKTDKAWLCKVSLRHKYIYHPAEAPAASKPKKASPGRLAARAPARCFEHFVAQDAVDYEFKEIRDPGELEDVLKWAQLAILHPNEDYRNYIPGDDGMVHADLVEPELKFSPNIIRLDIRGPDLPNLSFYDLPGVINRSENMDEAHLVSTVRNLVKSYIRTENSLVLLAQSMNNDPNVSSAAELVELEKAKGRCLGVLTKPDLIQHRKSWPLWRSVLDGTTFCLKHGYFVTKQPDQEGLDNHVTHPEARAQEADFFASQEPWATQFGSYAHRFGTDSLQSALSEKLTTQILQSLPAIRTQVQQKAESVEAELLGLPDPPADNLPVTLTSKINSFCQQARQCLEGGPGHNNEFHTAWATLISSFRSAIQHTRPTLFVKEVSRDEPETPEHRPTPNGKGKSVPDTPATPTPQRAVPSVMIVSDDSGEESSRLPIRPQKSGNKRGRSELPETPVKRAKMAERRPETPFSPTLSLGKTYSVADIRGQLTRGYTNGIPALTDPWAIVQLCQMSLEHWEVPLSILIDVTKEMIKKALFDRLEDVFEVYRQTELYVELSMAINNLSDRVQERLEVYTTTFYENEHKKQGTLDVERNELAESEAMLELRKRRRLHRAILHLDSAEKGGKVTKGQERMLKISKITDEQLGPDPYAREVGVMAKVQAYYKVAMNRFVDNVFLTVQRQWFAKIKESLLPELENRLGLLLPNANERCALLMVEDPQREIRRAQLKRDKEKLNMALDCLAALSFP